MRQYARRPSATDASRGKAHPSPWGGPQQWSTTIEILVEIVDTAQNHRIAGRLRHICRATEDRDLLRQVTLNNQAHLIVGHDRHRRMAPSVLKTTTEHRVMGC